MKINEIKEILAKKPSKNFLELLQGDERKSVKELLLTYYKKQQKATVEKDRFSKMLYYEKQCFANGWNLIAGVDEAGRGPLAGPLVIAAVILPESIFISGLNDSKKLTPITREKLYNEILSKAIDITVNIVSVSNIDNLNIYRATQQGMTQALEAMHCKPQVALIDAMPVSVNGMAIKSIIHGDALSASIAAASIIAKVTRDRIMQQLDKIYPVYNFAQNKGYGTKAHMQAIAQYGATQWHRRSFEPIKSMYLPPVKGEENFIYSPLIETCNYSVK